MMMIMMTIVPILVTLVGIVIDVSDSHPRRANSSNDKEVLIIKSSMNSDNL